MFAFPEIMSFVDASLWVVCAPGELLVMIVRALAAAVLAAFGSLPPWFSIRMVVEDWWKGYRQLFPTRQSKPLTVIAIQMPGTGKWRFFPAQGAPFWVGLSCEPVCPSSSAAHSRREALAVHAMRELCR